MGGRKHRLCTLKYSERRKSKRVTIPRVVSLPLSSYINGHVTSTVALHSRLASLSLPQTWIVSNATTSPISICKLRISSGDMPPRADVLVTLAIHADMKWSISFIDRNIDPKNCSLLEKLPSSLSSISSIRSAITAIDCSKICVGNSDDTFIVSWHRRSLTLQNFDGIIIIA